MKKILIMIYVFAISALFVMSQPAKAAAVDVPQITGKYLGGDKVQLWWKQVTGAKYQVIYGPADNQYAHGAVIDQGGTFTVGGLFKNTAYVFRIKTVLDGNVSSYSNNVRIVTGSSGRKTVNQNVALKSVSSKPVLSTMKTNSQLNSSSISTGKPGVGAHNLRSVQGPFVGSITLHWNDPMISEAGNYNIVYTDNPNVEKWGVLDIPNSNRSYTVGKLQSGVRYYFWISSTKTGRTPWISDIAR